SNPAPVTATLHHWDPNPKKSTMLRDFSAGLLSDGRLMETRVNPKEAATISRMLNTKPPKQNTKEAKKRTQNNTNNETQTESGEKAPKPMEPIDFNLLEDIPAWFRSMRL